MHTDRAVFNYICERITELQKRHKLSVAKIAVIAGYERAALYRVLNGKAGVSYKALYRLSVHFGLSMDFWFPTHEGNKEISLPELPQLATEAKKSQKSIPGMYPLTKKIIQELSRLTRLDKHQALVLLVRHSNVLNELLMVAEALSSVDRATKKRLVAAIMKVAKEKKPIP
jgi:transcriptional regulator with XRE-family HTH domain